MSLHILIYSNGENVFEKRQDIKTRDEKRINGILICLDRLEEY